MESVTQLRTGNAGFRRSLLTAAIAVALAGFGATAAAEQQADAQQGQDDLEEQLQREPLQEGDEDAAWLEDEQNGGNAEAAEGQQQQGQDQAAAEPQPRPDTGPREQDALVTDPVPQEGLEDDRAQGAEPPVEQELAGVPEGQQEFAARLRELSGHIGDPVVNPRGDELGEVEEIVTDPQDQSLQVVVSTGGVLGIGARRVVVPAEQLQPAAGELRTRTDMTQEQLEQMTEYQPERYQQVQDDVAGNGAGAGWGNEEGEPDQQGQEG